MTLLLKHIEEITTTIQNEAIEAIDQTRKTAVERIRNTIESIKAQAEALDIFLPMNLIDTIARGGSIQSQDFKVERPNAQLMMEIDHDDVLRPPLRLNKGHYRITLIVEKMDE